VSYLTCTEHNVTCNGRASFIKVALDNFRMTLFSGFSLVEKGLIGIKLWRNFGSLSCFRKATFSSFQENVECNRRNQQLNKRRRCSKHLVRWLRYSLGISPILYAFLNFKNFINFHILQGIIPSSLINQYVEICL
jgi:hypothetical protein